MTKTRCGFRAIAAWAVLVIGASGSAHAATYYVNAAAANDSGSGSLSSPKKYISSGVALMSTTGGDILIIASGTYGNALGSAHAFSFTTAPASSNVNYTISWATVSDARVASYRLYHGTTDPLTKTNRTAVVNVGNTNSYTVAGSALGVPGQSIYFAVAAVAGDGSESPLSSQDAIVIE